MKINNVFLGFFSVTVVALLAACSGSTTGPQATATSMYISYPTADYNGQRTVIDDGNFKMELGGPGNLPNELPRDVPIFYPGYPTNWNIMYSGKAALFSIRIEAGSDQSSVLDWYRSNLSSNGWMIGTQEVDLGSISCGSEEPEVIYAKMDNRILQVSVCATECHTYCYTTISLLYKENY